MNWHSITIDEGYQETRSSVDRPASNVSEERLTQVGTNDLRTARFEFGRRRIPVIYKPLQGK